MAFTKRVSVLLAFALLLGYGIAYPCSVMKITTNVELVAKADAVIRAKALEYVRPPDT